MRVECRRGVIVIMRCDGLSPLRQRKIKHEKIDDEKIYLSIILFKTIFLLLFLSFRPLQTYHISKESSSFFGIISNFNSSYSNANHLRDLLFPLKHQFSTLL